MIQLVSGGQSLYVFLDFKLPISIEGDELMKRSFGLQFNDSQSTN
jgi:hypothetical protein